MIGKFEVGKIPANKAECIEIDKITEYYLDQALSWEFKGKFIAIAIGVISLIPAIWLSVEIESLGLFFVLFLAGLIFALIVYTIFHAAAMRLSALASIIYNTKVTANFAMYENGVRPIKIKAKKEVARCIKCGSELIGDVCPVCYKEDEEYENTYSEGEMCVKCGALMKPTDIICGVCGWAKDCEEEAEPEEIEFFDVNCPNCNETLSFEKGSKIGECPFCGNKFAL